MEQPLFPPYLNAQSSDGKPSRGLAVAALQLLLRGYMCTLPEEFRRSVEITGVYGERFALDVKTLQRYLGFFSDDVDGNFGPETRARFAERTGIDIDRFFLQDFTQPTYWANADGELDVWPPAS